MSKDREFVPVNLAVMTVSDTRILETDTSGQALVDMATQAGHAVVDRVIVADNKYLIREIVSRWIADPKVDGILSTGGTGVTGRDVTPEAVGPLFNKAIDGFGELFRQISFQEIGTSTMQSRALGGVANGTFIYCLPGSTGACRTAWNRILVHQFDYRTGPCNLVELMPRLREH